MLLTKSIKKNIVLYLLVVTSGSAFAITEQKHGVRYLEFIQKPCAELSKLLGDINLTTDFDANGNILPDDNSFRQCFISSIDLNEDGIDEIILNFVHGCGSHGCLISVLQKSKNFGFHNIIDGDSSGIISNSNIQISCNKSEGYHDLLFYDANKKSRSIWQWNGKSYEYSKSIRK
ncbi:hypothetical protein JCM14076_11310 [Methylosoma difficile]